MMRTTSIRFTGLASGLDTESIVQAMMQPEQMKIDMAMQNKTLDEWTKDAWKDINKKVYDFHTKYLGNMRLQGTFNKKIITSSNPNVVDILDGGTLPDGVHTIDYVKSLAKGAMLKTSSLKTENGALANGQTTLKDLGIESDTVIKVNEGMVDSEGKLIETEIKLTSDMKISDLANKLKDALPNSNVNFDEGAGSFFISSKKTGESQKIELKIESGDMEALSKIGLADQGMSSVKAEGSNAVYSYNGVEVESETNSISINGLKATLKATTSSEIVFTSTHDTEAVVTFVKDFVNDYNALITEIHEKLDAPSAREYRPLTEAQKKEMSEKDIEAWEKKIKDSLLRKDPVLRELTSSMREIMGGVFGEGEYNTFAALGIESKDYKEKGKLTFNETKFREALSKDPDQVINTLTSAGKALYEDVSNKFSGNSSSSVNFLFADKAMDTKITEHKKKIAELEAKYIRLEDMYYKRFAAMETALNKLNSQSAWLGQQMM